MELRKSKFLKFFALLLFAFELLAPAYLASRMEFVSEDSPEMQLHAPTVLGNFSCFLYEEPGNEEEGRQKSYHKIFQVVLSADFVVVYNCLQELDNSPPSVFLSFERPSVRASLNTLYGNFRI